MSKWLVVQMIINNQDFSPQNHEGKPIEIEGSFSPKVAGQKLELLQFPGKKFEIAKVDSRKNPNFNNMSIIFVFDLAFMDTSRDKKRESKPFKQIGGICNLCNGTGTELLKGRYATTSKPCPNGCPETNRLSEEGIKICPICFNIGYLPNGDVCTSCILLGTFPAKS
ncbi:MAG: hypothetical protein PHZ07_01815 [Patescibacteria group bacterium]|nr:hypothetical protein [Patescibacteria group bacterium]MDD4304077.1 hypothetical protein [Patescibacteria group bacterium]MDD4694954.1 hypothetical protein [Patescibacteria group bacterium]